MRSSSSTAESRSSRAPSRGTAGLPGSAAPLSREFRQSLAAWRLVGELPKVAYLVGAGATAPGARRVLPGELGIPVFPLPPARFEETAEELLAASADASPRRSAWHWPSCTVAAVSTSGAASSPMSAGSAFFAKIPASQRLGAVITFSFLFATWAELRALGQERTILETSLSAVTSDVFGESHHRSAARGGSPRQDRVDSRRGPAPSRGRIRRDGAARASGARRDEPRHRRARRAARTREHSRHRPQYPRRPTDRDDAEGGALLSRRENRENEPRAR